MSYDEPGGSSGELGGLVNFWQSMIAVKGQHDSAKS